MMYALPPPPPPPPTTQSTGMPPAAQSTGMPPAMPPMPLATAMLPPPPPPAEPMPAFAMNQQHPHASMPPPIFKVPFPPSASSGLFTSTTPQMPMSPQMFDPSRPPHPMSSNKRRLDAMEAGPSNTKTRKEDNLPDSPCENCIQRELRIDFYKKHMYKLHSEEENQNVIYKKKLDEFESGMEILRSMVAPQLFRFLESYIDGKPTIPTALLLQLIKYMAKNGAVTHHPLVGLDTNVLQTLLRRRNNFRPPSPDRMCTTILEMMSSSNSTLENTSSGGHVNGGNRFLNGQRDGSPPGANGGAAGAGARFPPPPSSTPRAIALPDLSVPPPPFYPGGPPPAPARPFHPPQPYGPTTNPPFPNLGYNSGRMNEPGSQMNMRPPPPVAPNYNQFMMARYPHPPHYYPPFQ